MLGQTQFAKQAPRFVQPAARLAALRHAVGVLEREVWRQANDRVRKEKLVDALIERIKTLFEADF